MHSLLQRQLRKAFAGHLPEGEAFAAFLRAVDEAYATADQDRMQLERSLQLASDELFERNRRLETELEERKRLEIELRSAERLRAIGQLAAGIAQEINTPMQSISDSVHFLRDAFSDLSLLLDAYQQHLSLSAAERDALGVKIHELVEKIDLQYLRGEIPDALARCGQGTDRVAKIVRAWKELAHPDAHSLDTADINVLIENTMILAANEIRYVADVELQLAGRKGVLCRAGEIQQALLNLIVNACHAIAERIGDSGHKGHIRIQTREEADDFVVHIEDDGVGIPPAVQGRIFEPFFTTKPVGKGTGQGLSIARSLVVERHGGKLYFESTVGKGATFTMRLPIAGQTDASVIGAFSSGPA